MRSGFTELTTVTGARPGSDRTSSSATSKLPRTWSDPRAVDDRLGELAQRDLALRDDDAQRARPSPRRRRPRPRCCPSRRTRRPVRPLLAFEIATVIPRSLKLPVGFAPSTFNRRRRRPAPTGAAREERRRPLEQRDGLDVARSDADQLAIRAMTPA